MATPKSKPTHNPALAFIKPGWKGNPVNNKNQYMNLDGPSEKTFQELIRWQRSKNPFKPLKRKQASGIPVIMNHEITADQKNGITWLGHTSFVFCLNQQQIITDPVFYGVGPVKRHTKLPCVVKDLKNIAIILLSHSHRDHCDKKSMQELCEWNPDAVILTGLETGSLLRSWKIKNEIIEMGWYQQYQSNTGTKYTYLPAKHWSRRGLKDLNGMLWGSFLTEQEGSSIYYGADSGLGIHFKEIAALFPEIDFALLGIGAYEPEWFMSSSHTSPENALKAFAQLKAKYFIPMHHGSFDLSDEPVFYPLQELEKLIAVKELDFVKNLAIGEKYFF
jgi:L-ascorbate metabolism protein UlaG (beta-lactamase superfamily)